MNHRPDTALIALCFCLGLMPATGLAQVGSSLCCPPGARPGQDRCIEVLYTSDDDVARREQCDAVLSRGMPQQMQTGFGFDNRKFVHNGFQGESPPDNAAVPPLWYAASDAKLPIQSPQCAPLRGPVDSCRNYFEVDAYIGLGDSISQREVDGFAGIHPWQGTPYSDRVVKKTVHGFDELRGFVAGLTQHCFVLRHVLISSHGAKGVVAFYDDQDRQADLAPVSDILNVTGLACALAPRARVQFDGCKIACQDNQSNGAMDRLAELTSIAKNPNYSPAGETHPFDGTWLLFNSTEGTELPAIANIILSPGWHWNEGIKTDDNGAILFMVQGDSVKTDVPIDRTRACD